ncbi:MAG: tRNA pseudouridine(55) synthase TruB [Chloroflexi bacterium]|nr:tRNA pseudouridine(55) synthase TruB [Chloroflexota bacterium]
MSRRRKNDADVHGLLNVRKPKGFTSHDVVAVVRRTLGTRRVGHAGTLDPMAEGVLPLCVGRYTRLVELIADTEKGYHAEIELGARTSTDDAEGDVLERRPLPDLTAEQLDAALAPFRGRISQTPPAFSAIKVAGQRAYDLARRGDAPELAAREVTVHRLELLGWQTPRLTVRVACSKGTYIRALARDLGASLGCGAHLTQLVRLWVGDFRLETAVSLDEIAAAVERDDVASVLQPADDALAALPAIVVDPSRLIDIGHGRSWPAAPDVDPAQATAGLTRVYDSEGRLLALADFDARRRAWQPRLALASTPSDGAATGEQG